MAVVAFPSLKPSARSWTPGSAPVQAFTALSGNESRVLLGPSPIGTSLSLMFQNLKEADCLSITSHYATAFGSYEIFDLPAAVFAGMTDYAKVTPASFKWRYAAPPSVDWVAPGIGNVSVSLLAVRS